MRVTPYRATPVWVFHQVADATRQEDPLRSAIPPEHFETQMRFLYDRRFRTVSLDQVFDARLDAVGQYGRQIALTFDDGYLDTYTNAFPILQRYGFCATVFLVSDRLAKRRNWGIGSPVDLMGWEHVKEMGRHGISFQSHTNSHAELTNCDHRRLRRELADSKKGIEDTTGLSVQYLAYPFGKCDKRVMRIAQESGYRAAYGTDAAGGDRYCMQRFSIHAPGPSWQLTVKTSPWASWLRFMFRGCSLVANETP